MRAFFFRPVVKYPGLIRVSTDSTLNPPALKTQKQGPHHEPELCTDIDIYCFSQMCTVRLHPQQTVFKQLPDNLKLMSAFLLDSTGLWKQIPKKSIHPQHLSPSFSSIEHPQASCLLRAPFTFRVLLNTIVIGHMR